MRSPSQGPFARKLVLAVAPIGLVFAALTIAGSIPGAGPLNARQRSVAEREAR